MSHGRYILKSFSWETSNRIRSNSFPQASWLHETYTWFCWTQRNWVYSNWSAPTAYSQFYISVWRRMPHTDSGHRAMDQGTALVAPIRTCVLTVTEWLSAHIVWKQRTGYFLKGISINWIRCVQSGFFIDLNSHKRKWQQIRTGTNRNSHRQNGHSPVAPQTETVLNMNALNGLDTSYIEKLTNQIPRGTGKNDPNTNYVAIYGETLPLVSIMNLMIT